MSLQLWNNRKSEFLSFSFNQDFSCFAAGTQTGYRVYRTFPFREVARREDFPDVDDDDSYTGQGRAGGLAIVEMLHMSSVLAVVGGGLNPRWPNNRVILWDDRDERSIAELAFKHSVKSVKLRRDVILIALETRIYLYYLRELEPMDHLETASNPTGICAMTSDPYRLVVACPYTKKGKVAICCYKAYAATPAQGSAREQMILISAHESDVACVQLNRTGTTVATASIKGTLVRVFETRSGTQLCELRRGADRAMIYSLAFDPMSRYIAATSAKGTLHLWALTPTNLKKKDEKKKKDNNNSNNIENKNLSFNNNNTSNNKNINGMPSNIHHSPVHSAGPSERGISEMGLSAPSPPGTGLGTPPAEVLLLGGNAADGTVTTSNVKSRLAFLGSVLPSYFSSSWSFAHARTRSAHGGNNTRHVPNLCAFVPSEDCSLVVLSADGTIEKFRFDPISGGEMRLDFSELFCDSLDFGAGSDDWRGGSNGSCGQTIRSRMLAGSPPGGPSILGTPPL